MTLNQVIARIERLARAHRQINYFYVGDSSEWLSNGEVQYPAVFCDYNNSEIDRANKKHKFTIELYFADQTNLNQDARRNELDVFSDLVSIAEDIYAMLSYSRFFDWTIGENCSLTFLPYQKEDAYAEVKMTVEISTAYVSNRCQVPADILFEEDQSKELTNFDTDLDTTL